MGQHLAEEIQNKTDQAGNPEANIPSNIYRPKSPLMAKVVENKRLSSPDSHNDVRHLVFDVQGSDLRYLEGQSIGILPPGMDKNGHPHKLRLYSIASPELGDDSQRRTLSLCVKRANTTDPETGFVYQGVCSNYLCDLSPQDVVKMTGPVGKSFLMPEWVHPDLSNPNIIMIATGTGIAPFRAFLHTRYGRLSRQSGQAWLFFGVQSKKDYLYHTELESYRTQESYRLITAFSREEKNPQGGRMYVQHRLVEHADAIIALLQQPNTFVYLCGLRGMEAGIHQGLQEASGKAGISWDDLLSRLKNEKRWLVEVY